MFRAFVTYPHGQQAITPANVRTEADRQAVLNHAAQIAQAMVGVTNEEAAKMSPQRLRALAARVEFFKVAYG
ncbi:hypothetical protein [uncultured Paludibaculum sp.]|uniref:hypothetical protein n=1 Tax=uncultured Paludibaculum sp. TaxID=1765020 RepID=UPI002AAB2680|nr:hypothetical protein [uncultured Paludibaculum sp.]